MSKKIIASFIVIYLIAGFAAAEPIGWRWDGTGSFPSARPVLEWDRETNVLWSTKTTSWGNACPIIAGDLVIVTAEPADIVALNKNSGEIAWQQRCTYFDLIEDEAEVAAAREMQTRSQTLGRQIGALSREQRTLQNKLREEPEDEEAKAKLEVVRKEIEELRKEQNQVNKYDLPGTHGANGYTSPTPIFDGERIYMLFSSGIAVAYDLRGNRLWARMLEKPAGGHGHSASPVLVGNILVCPIRSTFGLNRETGETVWQSNAGTNHGAAVAAKIGEVDIVITSSGDVIRADDGTVIRRRISKLDYAVPHVSDGVVYFVERGGKAIKLPEEFTEDMKFEELYTFQHEGNRYYASPLIHDGLIYAIQQQAVFSVLDAETGEVVYSEKLDFGRGTIYPSITLAGDKLFVSSDNGKTMIMEPGRELKILQENSLEPFRSTPIFIGTRMYVRGLNHVYCIGK